MKTIVKIGYIFTSIIFLVYLSIPNPEFPQKPSDALRSNEPADTEDVNRRAYFTNYNRQEVMGLYKASMRHGTLNIQMPTYRLNYPPEEAQTIIRDQTRSTFLEEVVHPFRESVFVNGFEPTNPKDAIYIGEKNWKQKIIVRQVNSNVLARLIVGIASLLIIPLLYKRVVEALVDLGRGITKIWTYR